MALSGQKVDGRAGGMGIVLNHAAIFCHPLLKRWKLSFAARNHLCNVLFNILRQLESGNGDSETLEHVQYRLDYMY